MLSSNHSGSSNPHPESLPALEKYKARGEKIRKEMERVQQIGDNDQAIITEVRSFIKDCAKANEWYAVEFFLDQLAETFPLYKLNLSGLNSENLAYEIAGDQDLQSSNNKLGMFVAYLGGYCSDKALETPSDQFYYKQHPEEELGQKIDMIGLDSGFMIKY